MKDLEKITIKINLATYTVEFRYLSSNELNRQSKGVCNTDTKQIFIAKDYPDITSTIRHEITHAVINEYLLGEFQWNEEYVCEFVEKYSTLIEELTNRVFYEYRLLEKELENDK